MLLAVQLAGSELLTFIVYVTPLSPLTTVGSFTVTSPVCPFTLVTHVELVKYPAQFVKSDVSVGIDNVTAQV
jgi:hypothetical protein